MEIQQIDKNRIIKELKEKGYTGKLVTYQELQALHSKYGKGLSEQDFAIEILKLSYPNYESCKNRKTKARVLNDETKELSKEEINKIIENLKLDGYENKSITYEKLQKLHEQYGSQLSEKDFAMTVLGLSYSNYMNCKNTEQRAVILKKEKLGKTEENDLITELERDIIKKLKRNRYSQKLITYEELQALHREYGQGLSEKDFAIKILGVTDSNYKHCKNDNTRIRILKEKNSKLTEKEKKKIIERLREKGYTGKSITYNELQKLHKRYGKGISEKDFAIEILGLSYSNYRKCKNTKSKVRILKERKTALSEEEKDSTIEKLKLQEYMGKVITYEELQALHKEYGEGLTERDFAIEILGLSYSNYRTCKNSKTRVKIKDTKALKKAKEIELLYFQTPGYYSKEVIEKICKEYQITIEEFIIYVTIKGFYDTTPYIEMLTKNNKLWIGKSRLSEEFVNKHAELLQEISNRVSRKLCYIYGRKDQEDYAQDTLIYIIENMGFYEKNLCDNIEEFRKICYATAKKVCRRKILNSLRLSSKFVGLNRKFTTKSGEKLEVQYADERVNVEAETIEKVTGQKRKERETRADECINLLKKHIEEGKSREEALVLTAQEMKIEPEKMLKYMQEYLITKGKVKIGKSGIVEINKDEETR